MSKKIKYIKGQIIGPYKNKYVAEAISIRKRKALFECGYCAKTFLCRMNDIKSGKQKSCGCANIAARQKQIIKYKKNQLIGSNGIRFVKDVEFRKNPRICEMKCHCGNLFKTNIQHVKTDWIKGCGCGVRTKFGLSKQPTYIIWQNMMRRCYKKSGVQYKDYGGRGIEVKKEWHNFLTFHVWAKDKYKKGLTLDRKNNDGFYSPKNCRFITQASNNRNRRNNLNYKGENATDASLRLGGNPHLVYFRHKYYGWSLEKSFNTPVIK